MSGLIYGILVLDATFPYGSREHGAVHGVPPNAGYHALYTLLRLHHPLLHANLSTASHIPFQKRNEPFSQYLRRLQDFMARERLATRTYTEDEALDLAVRNLTSEWRTEFRRMVERDKRTGPDGKLPFKLSLPQLATSFVEYAGELNLPPPSLPSQRQSSGSAHPPTAILRRIEAAPTDPVDDIADAEIDILVRALAQNQDASAVCVGCNLPGHTLVDCNRFVDHIVAEGLAQRHPQLRTRIANSHQQFRTRLSNANARARPPPSTASRTMRRIEADADQTEPPSPSDDVFPSSSDDDDASPDGYQLNAIQAADDDPEDFEACFSPLTIHSVTLCDPALIDPLNGAAAPVRCPPEPDPLVLRRLEATYDTVTSSSFAHADNGSMACTTNDVTLLFGYRPLAHSPVRLYDAGQHVHLPLGVGFLCIPVDHRGIAGAPSSIYVRTYFTPTIPGIIISHSAISKQLATTGYHTSTFPDTPGFIHFPHRLRRCQDVYVTIQPTSLRGGLTFTEALIIPTEDQRRAALPQRALTVRRLCSEHASVTDDVLLDPTDGMLCQACHSPSMPDFC